MDHSLGSWYPEERTNTWKKSTNKKKYRPLTKRWQVVLASINRSRHSNRNNRAHHQILLPRHSFRLTNGSGMTFLPRMVSWEITPAWRVSRRWWQKWATSRFSPGRWRSDGLLPKLRRDFGKRRCWEFLEPTMAGTFYIEEATRRDFGVLWIPTVISSTNIPRSFR